MIPNRRPMQIVLSACMLVLAALAGGCAQTVQVRRAALVQPPAPPMWSGRTRPTGITAGNNTVVWNKAPERDAASDSGLYVSSIQFDGDLHFSLGPTGKVSLWFPFSYGLSDYSFAAAPCLVERPHTGAFTGGIGVAFSTFVSQRWYLGTSVETLLAFVPSHIETWAIGGGKIDDDQDVEPIPVLRWSALVGVDFDWIRIFGSIGLRNHPTNTRISTETLTDSPDGEVGPGPFYGLVGLGLEVDLGANVSLLAQAYQPFPLYEHDLIYGPILGLTIDLHMDRS